MKRPGDIQLNQPPSKHYKSVTFSLPSPNHQPQQQQITNPTQQEQLESTSSTSQISPPMTGQSSLQHPPSSSSLQQPQQTIGMPTPNTNKSILRSSSTSSGKFCVCIISSCEFVGDLGASYLTSTFI